MSELDAELQQKGLEQLDIIMMKMFLMVGEIYTRDYIKQDRWFMKHSWTEAQQEEFIAWLANYLKSSKVQRILYETVYTDARTRHERATFFVFSYGWSLKE